MRKLYDSVDTAGIPAGATLMAGYVDHEPDQSYYSMKVRFPNANVRSICIDPAHDADILDIEALDARPDQAPTWAQRQRARGIHPVCYMALDTWQAVQNAFAATGVAPPMYWVADRATTAIPASAIGNQYADMGLYDISNFVDYVPGWDSLPVPPDPPTEDDDVNTGIICPDPTASGEFWMIDPYLKSRVHIPTLADEQAIAAIPSPAYQLITLTAGQLAVIPIVPIP